MVLFLSTDSNALAKHFFCTHNNIEMELVQYYMCDIEHRQVNYTNQTLRRNVLTI